MPQREFLVILIQLQNNNYIALVSNVDRLASQLVETDESRACPPSGVSRSDQKTASPREEHVKEFLTCRSLLLLRSSSLSLLLRSIVLFLLRRGSVSHLSYFPRSRAISSHSL
ncbi:hypothetical protein RJT34_16010 [Clitoria ternatea]|uniref:Uncharacterized protein n=1 Tax=Clitoria ternatea TaxID=43366 RepID=A0AAN9PDA9_CLITE